MKRTPTHAPTFRDEVINFLDCPAFSLVVHCIPSADEERQQRVQKLVDSLREEIAGSDDSNLTVQENQNLQVLWGDALLVEYGESWAKRHVVKKALLKCFLGLFCGLRRLLAEHTRWILPPKKRNKK